MADDLLRHLIPSRVDENELKGKIIPHLMGRGFKTVGDLEDLEKEDLEGFDQLTIRRILKLALGDKLVIATNQSDQKDIDSKIYISYVVCDDRLFVSDIVNASADPPIKPIDIKDIDVQTTKLADITQRIRNDNNIPDEQEIELYSHEGYPLQNNLPTSKAFLASWGISDGDFFYVMLRLKDQPGIEKFATLPELDHDVGTETFTIETQFSDEFSINAYIDCDSPEDIAQKVYSITDIPVPFIALYVRRGYTYERLSPFTELEDGDHIRVVLRDPHEIIHPRSNQYGRNNYKPCVQQSDNGIMKFYSILKFLCSTRPYNGSYNYEKLMSYLMTTTNFPPLLYALQVLKEHSFLSIAGWTALIEGCYFLFKAILTSLQAKFENSKVFEYADYIWSYFISQSHNIGDVSNVQSELCSLVCPLSGVKICNPVIIEGHNDIGSFDKDNILSKIKKNENFEFGINGHVPLECIKNNDFIRKLLMCNPWDTDRKVCVWRNPPKITSNMTLKKLEVTFSWFAMLKSLHELCIVNPQGLFSGAECLSYNGKGQLVYFMGSAKGTDEHRRIYNPLSSNDDYLELISKSNLETFGCSTSVEMISLDIKSLLKGPDEVKDHDSIKSSAIVQPQNSINWDIEEAVVVLLDTSGSMSCSVFPDMGRFQRIDAAKQLFTAFTTRTQAYKLHNAIGLTLFQSCVENKLSIDKNVEKFEDILTKDKSIKAGGGTHLTDAVIEGVNQLKSFTCRKRIVCLTDGDNGSSTPYSSALSSAISNNVVVDTILLTWPSDNKEQKALSHATGGVCVLPKSMEEALRYFEIDGMLSMKERPGDPNSVPRRDMSYFENLSLYPYETHDSFKSTYIESFKEVKTCSSQSYLNKHKERSNGTSRQRRIIKELTQFINEPHENITVYPSEQDLNKWKVLICDDCVSDPDGKHVTQYKGGNFVLSVEFPEKYPYIPPEIRFITIIHHCNVSSSSGRICHAILGDAYTPSTSMRDILSYIYGLLMCPDTDTPLDGALADEYGYLRNRQPVINEPLNANEYFKAADKYFEKARQVVGQHAKHPKDELIKELSG